MGSVVSSIDVVFVNRNLTTPGANWSEQMIGKLVMFEISVIFHECLIISIFRYGKNSK